MSKTISLAIAKAHLSECVRDVEHGDAILIGVNSYIKGTARTTIILIQ